jgi:hypothetical protein
MGQAVGFPTIQMVQSLGPPQLRLSFALQIPQGCSETDGMLKIREGLSYFALVK